MTVMVGLLSPWDFAFKFRLSKRQSGRQTTADSSNSAQLTKNTAVDMCFEKSMQTLRALTKNEKR
jgi:hypothetical protein